MDEAELSVLKQWFENWSLREGESLIWFKDMDEAIVGKALVYRNHKYRYVPLYDYELMVQAACYMDDDPQEHVDQLIDKYHGHMTPVVNIGRTSHPPDPTEPEEWDDDAEHDGEDAGEE